MIHGTATPHPMTPFRLSAACRFHRVALLTGNMFGENDKPFGRGVISPMAIMRKRAQAAIELLAGNTLSESDRPSGRVAFFPMAIMRKRTQTAVEFFSRDVMLFVCNRPPLAACQGGENQGEHGGKHADLELVLSHGESPRSKSVYAGLRPVPQMRSEVETLPLS